MRFRTLVSAPFVVLGLVSCGSDDSGPVATAPAGATVVTSIEGIAWDAKTYSATSVGGKVTIALVNDSSLPHNLHLRDAEDVDVGLALSARKRGEVHTESYTLAPGTYEVICTIAGHGNMKATMTVT